MKLKKILSAALAFAAALALTAMAENLGWNCLNCGQTNDSDDGFCVSCGTPRGASDAPAPDFKEVFGNSTECEVPKTAQLGQTFEFYVEDISYSLDYQVPILYYESGSWETIGYADTALDNGRMVCYLSISVPGELISRNGNYRADLLYGTQSAILGYFMVGQQQSAASGSLSLSYEWDHIFLPEAGYEVEYTLTPIVGITEYTYSLNGHEGSVQTDGTDAAVRFSVDGSWYQLSEENTVYVTAAGGDVTPVSASVPFDVMRDFGGMYVTEGVLSADRYEAAVGETVTLRVGEDADCGPYCDIELYALELGGYEKTLITRWSRGDEDTFQFPLEVSVSFNESGVYELQTESMGTQSREEVSNHITITVE